MKDAWLTLFDISPTHVPYVHTQGRLFSKTRQYFLKNVRRVSWGWSFSSLLSCQWEGDLTGTVKVALQIWSRLRHFNAPVRKRTGRWGRRHYFSKEQLTGFVSPNQKLYYAEHLWCIRMSVMFVEILTEFSRWCCRKQPPVCRYREITSMLSPALPSGSGCTQDKNNMWHDVQKKKKTEKWRCIRRSSAQHCAVCTPTCMCLLSEITIFEWKHYFMEEARPTVMSRSTKLPTDW